MRNRSQRQRKGREKGSMVIEAALILPVFVVLLFGIVEMSLMMFNKHVITAAAREAARQGVLYVEGTQRTADADIISSAQTILDNLPAHTFQDSDQEIQVVREGFDHGDQLEVTVSLSYDHLIISNFGIRPVNIQSKAIMAME